MTKRAMIVEDEPLARRTLREFIDEVDWLELAGEAEDGRRAVEEIDRLRPDLVFLDVHMPELSGIEVLQRVRHRPAVVFTTAYDQYAVAAFELEAVDYLVKPFGRKRFLQTLDRVRQRLDSADDLPPVAERANEALRREPLTRLFARKGDRIVPLQVATVSRIDGCDDYCAVHSDGQTYLVHLRLNDLEQRLDPGRFLRVHRSHILSLDHVKEMRPHGDRRLEVVLHDGSVVLASRAGSTRLRRLLNEGG